LSRAFEFALTTAVFGGLGALVDRWLGTSPVALVVLLLLGVVGQFARLWYAYDAQMRHHEAALPSAPGAHHTVPRLAASDRDRARLPSVTVQAVGLLRGRGRQHRRQVEP
jgi:sterol desaturase/sphingolipid hydroxylase (fatty acid hydroxylase superfamily)